MFTKIKTKLIKLLKAPQFWGCLSLLLVLVILPETSFAASPSTAATGTTAPDILNQTFAKLASIFQIFMNFLAMLLWPVLLLIGGLLQNDIVFGGGMEERMRLVWVEVRNIVNFTFVLALVGLAFYNALGVSEDKIKSILPKIIIGIIAVNFTFLASKLILDVANVVTVSVFSLPQSIDPNLANIQPSGDKALEEFQAAVCRSIYPPNGVDSAYIDDVLREKARQYALKPSDALKDRCISKATDSKISDLAKATPTTSSKSTTKSTTTAPTPAQIKDQQDAFAKDQGLRNCVKSNLICGGTKALAFNFNNVATISNANAKPGEKKEAGFFQENLKKLFGKYSVNNAALAMALNLQKVYDIKNVKIPGEFSRFTLNIIFSLVLFVIYASSYVALFAILVIRVLVLWMAVSLSPLIIFSKYGINVPEVSDKIDQLVDAFIKHAVAPIIIGGAMTLGFIMLKSFQGIDHSQMNLVSGSVLTFETALFNIPSSGMNTFKELMIAIATCGVIWLGVFKTAEGTWAAGFTNLLGGTLQSIGKFILQSPQYLPLVPLGIKGADGKEKRIPLAAALQGFRNLPSEFRSRAASDANAISQALYNRITGKDNSFNPAGKKLGEGTNKKEALAVVQHHASTGVDNPREFAKKLKTSSAFREIRADLKKKDPTFYKNFISALESGRQLKPGDPLWTKFLQLTEAAKYTAPTTPLTTPGKTPGQAAQGNAQDYSSVLTGTDSRFARARASLDDSDRKQFDKYKGILTSTKTDNASKKAKEDLQKQLADAKSEASKFMAKVIPSMKPILDNSFKGDEYDALIASKDSKNQVAKDGAVTGYATGLKTKYTPDQIRRILDTDLKPHMTDDAKRKEYIDARLKDAGVTP